MEAIFSGLVLLALAGGLAMFSQQAASKASVAPPGGKFRQLPKLLTGVSGLAIAFLLGLTGLWSLASTSYVVVSADEVGHLRKIYLGGNLEDGRIIATSGEKGFQSEILPPGFHVRPFVRVIYDIDYLPAVTIPDGYYGSLITSDGIPLPEGAIMAPAWQDDELQSMLDARHFLTAGAGYKGAQASVLKPGTYRLNLYLYTVRVADDSTEIVYDRNGRREQRSRTASTAITVVPAGHVGVVKSNITERGVDCTRIRAPEIEGALAVPLVPRGCQGIWREPVFPGALYLNRAAYDVTLVDTRVQTWEYKGGFTKRTIDLSVDQQGNLRQTERRVEEVYDPDRHADRAVLVKVEGWDVPLEVRALVQVRPENAPFVVASVGGVDEIENRILTPAIRSVVRNVAGGVVTVPRQPTDDDPSTVESRPTRTLDLIENREALENSVEAAIKPEGAKAGVDIMEVRFGEPSIPPELLVARQREQLAKQLRRSYSEERETQIERQRTEQARATADQQPELVRAQIQVQVAEQVELERQALGRAERKYLEEIAVGEAARAQVLGEDRVVLITLAKDVLSTLKETPELASFVTRLVPQTVVNSGSGGGIEGAAAVLGTLLGGGNRGE